MAPRREPPGSFHIYISTLEDNMSFGSFPRSFLLPGTDTLRLIMGVPTSNP